MVSEQTTLVGMASTYFVCACLKHEWQCFIMHYRKPSVLRQAVYCSVAVLVAVANVAELIPPATTRDYCSFAVKWSVANVAELIPPATTRDHKLGGSRVGTDGGKGAGGKCTKCNIQDSRLKTWRISPVGSKPSLMELQQKSKLPLVIYIYIAVTVEPIMHFKFFFYFAVLW